MAFKNRRSPAQRVPVNSEPFWVKLGPLKPADAGSQILLASFPKGNFSVLDAAVEVLQAFDGAASIDVGSATLPTDTTVESGVLTVVDADFYVATADITEATPDLYTPVAAQYATDKGVGKSTLIKGKAATVPCIQATIGGAPTTGLAYVHVLLSRIPTAPTA